MADTPLSLLERIRCRACAEDWNRMIALYTPLLRGWLLRHSVQVADADDLVQDVLSVLIEKLPLFVHSGRAGAFRTWLRRILVYQIRYYWRVKRRGDCLASKESESYLDQLESPASELTRQWEVEHDQYVVQRLLELIREEFTATTWQAFERYALQCCSPNQVAAELGMTVNAVLIARSRVLRRLREEASGLLDE